VGAVQERPHDAAGELGLFYNWVGTGAYEQTLRVDGVRQREVFIVNPRYPDAGDAGTISSTNRYLLGPDVAMAPDDAPQRGHRSADLADGARHGDLQREPRVRSR
jgi:hypothetical protein